MGEDNKYEKYGRNSIFVSVVLILVSTGQISEIKNSINSIITIEFKSIQLLLWMVQLYYIWRHWQLSEKHIAKIANDSAYAFNKKIFFKNRLRLEISKNQKEIPDDHRFGSIISSLHFKYLPLITVNTKTNGNGLQERIDFFVHPLEPIWYMIFWARFIWFAKEFFTNEHTSQAYLPAIFFLTSIAVYIVSHLLWL